MLSKTCLMFVASFATACTQMSGQESPTSLPIDTCAYMGPVASWGQPPFPPNTTGTFLGTRGGVDDRPQRNILVILAGTVPRQVALSDHIILTNKACGEIMRLAGSGRQIYCEQLQGHNNPIPFGRCFAGGVDLRDHLLKKGFAVEGSTISNCPKAVFDANLRECPL